MVISLEKFEQYPCDNSFKPILVEYRTPFFVVVVVFCNYISIKLFLQKSFENQL